MTSDLRNLRRDSSRSPKYKSDTCIHKTNNSISSPRVQRTRYDRKRSRERSSNRDSRKYDNCTESRSRRKHSPSPEKRKRTKHSSRHQSPTDVKRDGKENHRTEILYRRERCEQSKTTYDKHKKHSPREGCHKKHQSPSSKSKGENETNNNGRTKATLTSFHNPEKIQEVCDQSSDSDESIDSLDAAFSTQSTDKKVLDLDALGAKSEKRIRKHNLVPLPDSDSFYFERQKERYYANMHKLIVTARSQIQSLEQKIEVLNKRQESHSTLKCPQCKHQFSTGQNRLLPKYVRVLQSTNRVELQFENMDSIKNWLIAYDLDRDAKGIPCFISETKPKGELTLADVKSTLMNVKLQKEAY